MPYQLQALKRAAKGARVRAEGKLPAVVYGGAGSAESVALGYVDFLKLYRAAGASTLLDLMLEGAAAGKVIIQAVQHDPVSDQVIHVDLKRIDMARKLRAPVALKFVGEAPIVKASGGTLVTSVHTVEVECLPQDLAAHIEVSLAGLNTYDDVIKVKDLAVPPGIKIVSPQAEDLVVKAAPALTEEQIKALEEAAAKPADLSAIEVAGKKKEDEGAAEAGAEAAKNEKAPTGGEAAGGKKEEKKEEKK